MESPSTLLAQDNVFRQWSARSVNSKNICRSIVNVLYNTRSSSSKTDNLADFAFVFVTINLTPVADGNTAFVNVRQCLVGRGLDNREDVRMEFGQCIHAPNDVQNSMKPRFEGCGALLPVGNAEGSNWCCNTRYERRHSSASTGGYPSLCLPK